jgi:hypothetical protein
MKWSVFLFLSWPLDELGWFTWHESFSLFYSLVSRVASSARAYLLAMASIASDVLGFFMATLQIMVGSLSPFFLEEHDNGLVVDLRDDTPLIAEMLYELSEGLSLLLDDTG